MSGRGGESMSQVKSINSLMKYLRNKHNVNISGSNQKRKLRNIGYYHGYKGYRFISNPNNKISFTDFKQIIAINTFDMELKTLFYPQVMFIETALKNYVLEVVLNEGKTDSFYTIYETLLTNYKQYNVGSNRYKTEVNKRLKLRNKFYNVLSRNFYSNKQVVQHFYHQDRAVPIWAIFEVISLGEFGNFVACLNEIIKHKISMSLNFNQACDSDGRLTERIIFTIKDLRNAIAHNDVIFDTRFKSNRINNTLKQCLQFDTNITNNITFDTIVDYLILIIYILKNLGISKNEINKMITRFENVKDQFRTNIPISIFNQVIYTDTRNKLNLLKNYI